MVRSCDSGGRRYRSGSAPTRLASAAGRSRLGALALLLAGAVAWTPAAAVADEPGDPAARPDGDYIVNLENFQSRSGADSPAHGAWPSFGAVASPTGVFLPDSAAYVNLTGGDGESTYVTPRVQGVQISVTADRNAPDATPGAQAGAKQAGARPTSIGASFANGDDDFEVSVGGDYGSSSNELPGSVRLVDEDKLLRVGAHARIREFTLGGAIGGDIEPGNVGQTLSWDAFGRYDFGALAIGFVYNYTVESDSASGDDGGMPGTLQGGVSYFFTPRMAVSTNLAYGSYGDQGGGDEPAMAGVLGFSLDF